MAKKICFMCKQRFSEGIVSPIMICLSCMAKSNAKDAAEKQISKKNKRSMNRVFGRGPSQS